MQRALSVILMMLVNVMIFNGGCATTTPRKDLLPNLPPLVWPPPPEDPRIEHLFTLTAPGDLKSAKSFWQKVWEFVLGSSDEKLIKPFAITVDGKGKVYVTDTALPGVHIFNLVNGEYQQFSEIKEGQLEVPVGIAVNPEGNIYVSDSALRRIFIFNARGKNIGTIGGPDLLIRPTGLAVAPRSNRLYVVDTLAHRVLFFSLQGELQGQFGQRGERPGEFNFPTHLFIDKEGFLYITDSLNFRIQIFDSTHQFVTAFGELGDRFGQFSKPKGVAVDGEGHIYVVESFYDYVNIYDRQGRYLLSFGGPGSQRGKLWLPTGIYIDGEDKIYVADTYNARLQVYKFLGGYGP